jgi:putative phosphoribosyl transferase
VFRDRAEGGRLLGEKLTAYRNRADAIILALPRGGVAVGFAVYEALSLPLDVLITRKLRAPENPEYALGALTETGYRYINPDIRALVSESWGKDYLERETAFQTGEIERRKQLYRDGAGLPTLDEKAVLLIDDGIATGSTVIAAVRGLRALAPSEIVVGAPVASRQAAEALTGEADGVVVVSVPERFCAVGEHYDWFPQVTDSQVVAALRAARGIPTEPASGGS